MKPLSIYVHIPFCRNKCLYCDFNSFRADDAQIADYVDHLIEEIRLWSENVKGYRVETIFIGGGTPSSIDASLIVRIAEALKHHFRIAETVEFSIECNPESVTVEKITAYKASGINRISMGVQSFDDAILKTIGRIHDRNKAITAYGIIREAGIDNVNLDLMLNLPGQKLAQVDDALDRILELDPEHLSAYSLKVEEGTPFYKLFETGRLDIGDEEEDRDYFYHVKRRLETKGYHQYEISNFSKPGYESRHNLTYWRNNEYLGIGLGAHGKFNEKRYNNEEEMSGYLNAIDDKRLPIAYEEVIDREMDLFETIMLGLRLMEGLDIKRINDVYGIDFSQRYKKEIEKLKNLLLVEVDEDRIRLTEKGVDLSNQVFLEFMQD